MQQNKNYAKLFERLMSPKSKTEFSDVLSDLENYYMYKEKRSKLKKKLEEFIDHKLNNKFDKVIDQIIDEEFDTITLSPIFANQTNSASEKKLFLLLHNSKDISVKVESLK